MRTLTAIIFALLIFTSAWAQNGSTPTASPTNGATSTASPTATPVPIVVTPQFPTIPHGTKVQMTATLNGQNVTSTAQWLTSNANTATVSAGLVTGVAAGFATVQAQSNGSVGWATVSVF